jgi:hypothetical protein
LVTDSLFRFRLIVSQYLKEQKRRSSAQLIELLTVCRRYKERTWYYVSIFSISEELLDRHVVLIQDESMLNIKISTTDELKDRLVECAGAQQGFSESKATR